MNKTPNTTTESSELSELTLSPAQWETARRQAKLIAYGCESRNRVERRWFATGSYADEAKCYELCETIDRRMEALADTLGLDYHTARFGRASTELVEAMAEQHDIDIDWER